MKENKQRGVTTKIHRDKNKVEIDGEMYPPTRHNWEVWQKYQSTGDKKELKRLSKVELLLW